MRGTESVESAIYSYILKFTFNKIGRKLGSLCKKILPKIEKNRPFLGQLVRSGFDYQSLH